MLHLVTKDITTVDRGIIVHGCNCQGVMGSGVAKFLRDKYPEIFPSYHERCEFAKNDGDEDVLLGDVDVVNIRKDLFVVNGFTQSFYGKGARSGKYATEPAITGVLTYTYTLAHILCLPVYAPKIGAGRGGLDWSTEVEPIFQKIDASYPHVNTYICSWAE